MSDILTGLLNELLNNNIFITEQRLREIKEAVINHAYSVGTYNFDLECAESRPDMQSMAAVAILRLQMRLSSKKILELGDQLSNVEAERMSTMSFSQRNNYLFDAEQCLRRPEPLELMQSFDQNQNLTTASAMMSVLFVRILADAALVAGGRRAFLHGRRLRYLDLARNAGWNWPKRSQN